MLRVPEISPKDVRAILEGKGIASTTIPYCVLGIRGYYENSMGAVGQNDFGIYDDAIIQVFSDHCVAWQGNTDPSSYKPQIAVLEPGVWRMIAGIHHISNPAKAYPAFRQHGNMTVKRVGSGTLDRGYFGINNHRGGINGTSSAGCQTIPVQSWEDYRNRGYKALGVNTKMVWNNQSGAGSSFPYVLVTRKELEKLGYKF